MLRICPYAPIGFIRIQWGFLTNKEVDSMRNEIKSFAMSMEKVMKENDVEKGDSWKEMDYNYMRDKLLEEVLEYLLIDDWDTPLNLIGKIISQIQYKRGGKKPNVHLKELLDIANVCMMEWNRQQIMPLSDSSESSGGS